MMRNLLLASAALALLGGCAHAQTVTGTLMGAGAKGAGGGGGGGGGLVCSNYGVDNGCAASTTYVANPGVIDTNAAFDAAQSGQLPSSPSAGQIAAYNALLHAANVNIPTIDYAVGAQASYTSGQYISTFAGDSICTSVQLPPPLGSASQVGSGVPAGVPYILCQGTGVTGATSASTSISGTALTIAGSITGTIKAGECISGTGISTTPPFPCVVSGSGNNWTLSQNLGTVASTTITYGPYESFANYDFTNGGVASVVIAMKPSGTAPGVAYNFQNDTFKAGSFSAYCSAPGTCGAANTYTTWSGTSSVVGALLFLTSSSGSHPPPNLTLTNITCDGGFGSAPNVTAARVGCVQDNRTGSSSVPFQWPTTVLYSVFQNFGHNPIQGASGGDVTIKYSANINTCLSATGAAGTFSPLCHGEWEEAVAAGTTRNFTMVGNYTLRPSVNINVAATTDFYLTSGAPNSTVVNNADVENNVSVWNYTNCTNSPVGSSALGGLGGYGPNNACGQNSGQPQYGGGFLSFTYVNYVNNLTMGGNVFDNTSSYFGFQALSNNRSSLGITATTTAPNTFTVTQPSSGYQNGPTSWNELVYVGELVVDHNATGFVQANITAFGTYTNTGTPGGTGCASGPAGCGTMTLNQTEPTLSGTGSNWEFFPGMFTISVPNTNYCIGSGAAKAITNITTIPWGISGTGAVSCP